MTALTAVALYSTTGSSLSSPVKVIVWIFWGVLFVTFGYFTSKGRAFVAFAADAKVELQKVVWPNRQETVQTTSIVMIMVTVTGFVLWGIDSLMMWIIAKITHLG